MCKKKYSLSPTISPLMPITHNQAFSPGMEDTTFKQHAGGAMIRAFSFMKEGRWFTLPELQDSQQLRGLGFWSVLQVHHFLHSNRQQTPLQTDPTSLEQECLRQGTLRHSVPVMYATLSISEGEDLALWSGWERNLETTATRS